MAGARDEHELVSACHRVGRNVVDLGLHPPTGRIVGVVMLTSIERVFEERARERRSPDA